jgi:hypothetical protein
LGTRVRLLISILEVVVDVLVFTIQRIERIPDGVQPTAERRLRV